MSRNLGTALEAAVASERSTLAYLFEFNSSGGTLRMATTPQSVEWDGHTWVAVGGHLQFGEIQESSDLSGQAASVVLDGVDQTVISTILTHFMRGHEAVVYLAHLGDDGTVTGAYELFRGFENDAFEVETMPRTEEGGGGTCKISTKLVSRLAELGQVRAVRTNVHSHRDMLRRAGFTGGDLNDLFFSRVPELVNKPIYWGRDTPEPSSFAGGPDPGGRGGRDREPEER